MRWVVYLCAVGSALGAAPDVNSQLKAEQNRNNRAQTIQVVFQQSYSVPGRPPKTERGVLFLRKPGRMRWQYDEPKGKLFISDNKQVFLYTPAFNRVQRMKVRESADMRTPLALLLGKLDFWRDFQRFVSSPAGADTRLKARPRSEEAPYTDVEFVVTPTFEIKYLRIDGQDGSIMEFRFSGEKLNPPLAESLFRFTPPPGAEVIEGVGGEDEGP